MTKVLFLCVHNSARSQMAEAFMKKYGAGRFEAESAGLEPGKLNPYVIRAMLEKVSIYPGIRRKASSTSSTPRKSIRSS